MNRRGWLTGVAASAGALILFLLRRTQGDVREEVEEAPEAAEHPVDQEEGAAKDQEEVGAVEEPAEERKRTVREFVRELEEHSASQVEAGASEGTGGESGGAVRDSARRSEESSGDQEGSRSEETAEEEASRTGARDSADEQMTVVGVLAKMGEAFEETGGGRFILSSEGEGNFDLRGKEDELDDVYQQQIQARVVGRIVDEESQPRKMEVDEVEPA